MSRYNYSPARFIIAQVLLYLLLFWWFAEQFRFAFGPDFVSYSSIAKKYAAGDISSAINSWWSPAYSWLLAICSIFSKDPLIANKILQCCIGLPALFLVRGIIFFHSKEKKDIYAEWLILAFMPALVFWGLTSDTPDFCSAVCLLWFFLLALKNTLDFSPFNLWKTGIAGGLAFLFKSYNFYFIAVYGLLVIFVARMRQKADRPLIAVQGVHIWTAFMEISLVWMLILMLKYERIMVSSIGWHEPCTNQYVLQIKPNAAAADCAPLQFDSANLVSNWETPAHYPVSSINSFLKQENTGQIFLQNTKDFFRSFVSKYQLALFALFLILLWNYWRKNGYLYLAFWAVYCGGYFLFHLEPRFFIMPSLLLMIAISVSFLRLNETINTRWFSLSGTLVIAFLFIHSYLFNLLHGPKNDVPQKVHEFYEKQNASLEGKHIAAAAGMYDEGIYLSFFSRARFYGSLTAPADDPASLEQLKRNKIDYLLRADSAGLYRLERLK